MQVRLISLLGVLLALTLSVHGLRAQTLSGQTDYGSFIHFDDFPETLFLVGEIKEGDFFQLRRAMRENDLKLIVASSPGGNVYEALQVATAIHDKGLSTYVPPGGDCASACSFVFFGGAKRLDAGQLGVHQFYASGEAGNGTVDVNTGLRDAQYTASEIIGFLNEFDTPPFVYERMFSTEGMHYFAGADVDKLSLLADDSDFVSLRAKADAKFAAIRDQMSNGVPVAAAPEPSAAAAPTPAPHPEPQQTTFTSYASTDIYGGDLQSNGIRGISISDCETICLNNTSCQAYSYVVSKSWCWPKAGVGTLSPKPGVFSAVKSAGDHIQAMRSDAAAFLAAMNHVWSLPNPDALFQIPAYYAPSVDFYGETITLNALMVDKRDFAVRWPVRNYVVEPDSVTIVCVAEGCKVESIVAWTAIAPDRNARSSGRSTWNLVLMATQKGLYIIQESGKVISRN